MEREIRLLSGEVVRYRDDNPAWWLAATGGKPLGRGVAESYAPVPAPAPVVEQEPTAAKEPEPPAEEPRCSVFGGCSAPLCPLDAGLRERVWYCHEDICTGRAGVGLRWVEVQRRLAGEREGYFTVAMLERVGRVGTATVGVDPESRIVPDKAEQTWCETRRPCRALTQEEVERARRNTMAHRFLSKKGRIACGENARQPKKDSEGDVAE